VTYTSIDQAQRAIAIAVDDICADNMVAIEMGELSESDVAHTALQAILPDCTPQVATMLRRAEGI
jgi:hypothetical protein